MNQKPIPDLTKVGSNASKGKLVKPKKLFNLQNQSPNIKDVLTDLKKLVEFLKR